MTERLYLTDAYLRAFSARVVAVEEGGERAAVVLDRTAFYPTSGGQLHDVGRLGAHRVLDVEERNGDVVHVVDGPLPPGDVEGEVDWAVRFDHMQQHTGQHLLSACLEDALGAATVSFHMGEETSTIDVTAPAPDDAALARVEDIVNERIWENRPVRARIVDEPELRGLALRKDPAVESDIRVVTIEGVDHSPCGGTHLRATGEIGAVHLLGTERVKQGTRLAFVCGRRALLHARGERRILGRLAARFTTREAEVPAAVEKLEEAARASRKREDALTREIVAADAERVPADGVHVRVAEGWSGERAGAFARALAARGVAAGIIVPASDAARGADVLVAAPRGGSRNAGDALRAALAEVGGRGGGGAEFARGSLAPGVSLDLARSALVRALGGAD